MTDRVGHRLGNYRLTRLLGQGGFAEVYLGEHVYLGTQAAIKVLHTALAEEHIEQFRCEARTIANLTHLHIIRVLEFGIENNVPFLAMDYAPAGTLRSLHPRGCRVLLPRVVSYVKQIASALQYAHDKGLIHRDIKPENMLVNQQQQVMLSDFGIALTTHSSRYQSPQQIAGTAAYMAPEQLMGHARRASDQYALAVVVFEWLCGELPFRGSFQEIASQHCLVPPPSLRKKIPALAPEIEQVVLTALAKDPEQRFGCVQDFADAFEQVSQTRPVGSAREMTETRQAYQPQPGRNAAQKIGARRAEEKGNSTTILPPQTLQTDPFLTPTKLAWGHSKTIPASEDFFVRLPEVPDKSGARAGGFSRRALMCGLGAVGALVIGGGAIWEAWPSMSSLYHQFVPLYTYRGHSNHVTSLAWFPDGKRIVSSGDDETGQIWDAFDGGHAIIYKGEFDQDDGITEGITSVACSPNGKLIASGGIGSIVQIWNALDQHNVYVYRGHLQPITSVAWSPDGKRVASGGGSLNILRQDNTIQVWDALDGGQVIIYRGHLQPITSVAWSPDGKYIASASLDHTVQIWNALDGSHIYTYQGHANSGYIASVAWSPDSRRIVSAGGDDGTVQVWDALDGGHVYSYHGHSNPTSPSVNAASWSPDGKRIASGGSDNTVQVWDALDGGHVTIYRGHSDHVASVAWSLDGKYIASGSFDYTVQIYPAG